MKIIYLSPITYYPYRLESILQSQNNIYFLKQSQSMLRFIVFGLNQNRSSYIQEKSKCIYIKQFSFYGGILDIHICVPPISKA